MTVIRSVAVSWRATWSARHSRVCSSSTERMRSLPPLSVRSRRKSQLQTWLTRCALVGIVPVERPRRRGRLVHRRTRKPCSLPDALHFACDPPASLLYAGGARACGSPDVGAGGRASRSGHANAATSRKADWAHGAGWSGGCPGNDKPFAASRAQPLPRPGPLAASAQGSPFFCVHRLQHPDLEQAVGEHLLELGVLLLQLPVLASVL